MKITNYTKLGKKTLKAITGVQRPHKVIKDGETTYYNEANRFHITNTERLSKLQVKQFLLYHFIDINRFGVARNIAIKDLASKLNCTINTIKNNNIRLKELNYIDFTEYISGRFSVLIIDYKDYHLTRREGGSGYITMSQDTINALIELDDVNALRLEIRKLIKIDGVSVSNIGKELPGEYSYNDMSLFLPKYISYKKKITSFIEKSKIFKTKVTGNKIEFILKDIFSLDYLYERMSELSLGVYNAYRDIMDINFEAILNKSVKYGVDRVTLALENIRESYIEKNRKIKNIEGLLVAVIVGQNNQS